MNLSLRTHIEQSYGFSIQEVQDAPRQFVALTYFIKSHQQETYFVKVVNKPHFITEIVKSLPMLHALQATGFKRAAFPIPTLGNTLYTYYKHNALVVLYEYIDAKQSYAYSNQSLGRLTAEVHLASQNLTVQTRREDFGYLHHDYLLQTMKDIGNLKGPSTDPILLELRTVFAQYESRIKKQLDKLYQYAERAKAKAHQHPFVMTHGDSPGNVLVKSRDDLYFIDWDDIIIAPRERDTWNMEWSAEYMAGYREIFPGFELDPDMEGFFVVRYMLNSIVHHLKEIVSKKEEGYRRINLQSLVDNTIEGWIKQHLIRVGAYDL